ncbi:protein phosphatase 2C domain-containing protein [Pararhodobacter sp. SW119]|uniref:PP2C family protein-serine/threonine phosphatase n=1 Tax=Pararhodobacter sp. SW119 TaxID=2780075 RepID=UPI001ADFD71D|nr:protein phosphatase 2C domain-containing protein [Pararhodobacter sp. SW119]
MSGRPVIRFSATSHVGRVRKVNEDAILATPETRVWAVADGMGGHAAGDVASRIVIDQLAMLPEGQEPADLMRAVRDALHRAHDQIRQEAAARQVDTMGATVVTLVLADGHFVAFWAGDSRLYRFRDGEVEMLTTDHSAVAEMVLDGEMTWDEAELHPLSNMVTRAVGVGEELELDKVRGELHPGDRFLLCSDGLSKYATFATLRRLVPRAPIETVTDTLLNLALDGGANDNVSIIVVDVL